jgi:amino acid transporter
MKEKDLIQFAQKSRMQIVISQLAPTFLLITTVGLVTEVRAAGTAVVWATLGILLASGILGALVQFTSADEFQATARDLRELKGKSAAAKSIISWAPMMHIVKFITTSIFVVIFVALVIALTQ